MTKKVRCHLNNIDNISKQEINITHGKFYKVIKETFTSKGKVYTIENDLNQPDEYFACFFSREEIFEENVDHPQHYGGKDNPYEAIKVIESWKLGFCLGNTIKYISRAGKKDSSKYVEDLEKAAWYLQRKIQQLKEIKND